MASHTASTQIGSSAIAHPAGLDRLPPTAPELHHNAPERNLNRHTASTQLGSSAVAHPAGQDRFPAPAPELHHNKIVERKENKHTASTQLGSDAVAHPAGADGLPRPMPEQHHLNRDHKADFKTQLGGAAVAHHSGVDGLPAPVPELYHLNGAKSAENAALTSSTQVGSKAVAPTIDHLEEDAGGLVFHELPPFPEDVPTVPLLRVNLAKLMQRDAEEVEKLWKACCEIGFFYLDLRDGLDRRGDDPTKSGRIDGQALLGDVDKLFGLGEEFFALPVEEKKKYDFAAEGSYFGYKGMGAGLVDAKGTKDRNEFFNTSKDDILGLSKPLPTPAILKQDGSRRLFESYMRRSHAVISLILGLLDSKLQLPKDTLKNLHRLQEPSGDQVRWVRSPPQPTDDRQKALGEHTDFGSMTLLFNRLGGLQVMPPGENQQWCYVKPLRGHCIVNLGDAMVKLTAGVLRSNIHRVVNPPGKQEAETRMSLVYFCRPEDKVMLRVLDGSEVIDSRKKSYLQEYGEEEISAKDWTLRRALGRRGVGDFDKSNGTEGKRMEN